MKVTAIKRNSPSQEIRLRQEDKLILMMSRDEVPLLQFESVLILIRILMTREKNNARKNHSPEIQLRQEDKLIPILKKQKVPLPQFESVLILIQMQYT
jgi:hypothetical protein